MRPQLTQPNSWAIMLQSSTKKVCLLLQKIAWNISQISYWKKTNRFTNVLTKEMVDLHFVWPYFCFVFDEQAQNWLIQKRVAGNLGEKVLPKKNICLKIFWAWNRFAICVRESYKNKERLKWIQFHFRQTSTSRGQSTKKNYEKQNASEENQFANVLIVK